MDHLTDYLEILEDLPQDLRDGFAELRELDAIAQNKILSLETRKRNFFEQCKRGELQSEAAIAESENLRKEYSNISENADQKIALATRMEELVQRYSNRLDSDLLKVKSELEANKEGITEILEKRSLELDDASSNETVKPDNKRTRNTEARSRSRTR